MLVAQFSEPLQPTSSSPATLGNSTTQHWNKLWKNPSSLSSSASKELDPSGNQQNAVSPSRASSSGKLSERADDRQGVRRRGAAVFSSMSSPSEG